MTSSKTEIASGEHGFSILELLVASTVTLVLLGLVSVLISQALGTRDREGRKTDALTSAHSALNVMSREIANSGFGLNSNGIIIADSNSSRLHIRANVENDDQTTGQTGEDVTYFHDKANNSVLRYDPNETDSPTTSAVIYDVSEVEFVYYDYIGSSSNGIEQTIPTSDTGRVTITVTVNLPDIQGQPSDQKVEFTSDVTLRNSAYMLSQY